MDTAFAVERLARHGSTPRQRRWWEFRAVVAESQYDHLVDWFTTCDENGSPVLSRDRRPLVQLGEAQRLVLRVLDALVGVDASPVLEVFDGDNSDSERAVSVARVLEEGLGLPAALTLPALDLLGGSCVLAFSRPDPTKPERHDWVRLQPEWCDVVFAPQARTARARAYARELAQWVEVPSDAHGPHLPVPADARAEDVVFLRYQVRTVDEVPEPGGVATRTVVEWHRTDYLPDVVVPYAPVEVVGDDARPPARFAPAGEVEPHGWGLVPVVWAAERTAEPGHLDGRSLLSPSVLSLARQADYVASFGVGSTNRNADPDLYTIDLADEAEAARQAAGVEPVTRRRVTGGKSFQFTSLAQSGGKIGLLESSGTPQEAAREMLADLRQALAENSGVVRHDPEKAGGAQSGEAMKRMLQPFIALVQGYRATLTTALERLARLAVRVLAAEGVIAREGLEEVVARLTWPDVVPLSPSDALAWANVGVGLVGVGYPQDEVVRLVATKLGHRDAAELVQAAATEAEARLRAAQQAMGRRGAAQEPPAGEAGGTGSGARSAAR